MDCQPTEKTSVLVFDQNPTWAEGAAKVLKDRGYDVDVVTGDFDLCKGFCGHKIYWVMVVNLNSVPRQCLPLAELVRIFPQMTLLAVTDNDDPSLPGSLKEAGVPLPHTFGPKGHHLLTDLGDRVDDILKARGRDRREMEIEWPAGMADILEGMFNNGPKLYPDTEPDVAVSLMWNELAMIIRQMFAAKGEDKPIAESIKVEPFRSEGGNSASELFELTPVVLLDTGYNKSALLKFGPKEETLQESRNYDRFVEWFVHRDKTVRKMGYSHAARYAGILYSYPRDDKTGFVKFSEHLRRETPEKSLEVIEAIFSPENKHWLAVDGNSFLGPDQAAFQTYYFRRVLGCTPWDLINRHRQRLWDDLERVESSTDRNVFSANGKSFKLPPLSLSFPEPVDFMTLSPLVEELKMTVVHGDLHADNLLVDEEKEGAYYFIDFKFTGFGHIYQDFIELELSLRHALFHAGSQDQALRLDSGAKGKVNWEGQKKLLVLENALIKQTVQKKPIKDPALDPAQQAYDPNLAKAFRIITRIRELARANHPEGMRHYFLGMIPAALRALRYHTYPLDVRLSRYVLAGLYTDLAPRLDKLL
jgi:hypothetical protein